MRGSFGSRSRRASATASSVSAPNIMRPNATWSGASASTPILMKRKLAPQMSVSARKRLRMMPMVNVEERVRASKICCSSSLCTSKRRGDGADGARLRVGVLAVAERHLDAQAQHLAALVLAANGARQLVDVELLGDEGHAADRVGHGEFVEHRRLASEDGPVGRRDGRERARDLPALRPVRTKWRPWIAMIHYRRENVSPSARPRWWQRAAPGRATSPTGRACRSAPSTTARCAAARACRRRAKATSSRRCGRGAATTTPPTSWSRPSSTWRGACGANIRARSLGIGDMSLRGGGDSVLHRSHENGRDLDLIYYAVDERGRPVAPVDSMPRYPFFDLRAREPGPQEHGVVFGPFSTRFFDVKRNWALVRALLEEPGIEIQYLFIHARLRERLLAYAARGRRPVAARARRGASCISRATRRRTTITCTCASSAPRTIAPSAVATPARCAGGRSATSTWCRRCRASASTSSPVRWRSSSASCARAHVIRCAPATAERRCRGSWRWRAAPPRDRCRAARRRRRRRPSSSCDRSSSC